MKTPKKKKIWAGPLIQQIFKIGQNIKGKTLNQARKLYPQWVFRATIVDGQNQITDMELRSDRVNVELKNNKIVKIVGIG